MTIIRTMQDLHDNIDGLGYKPSVVNQIRPRIADCARVYKAPLNKIPADLADFEERWGRGRVAAIAAGFQSHERFVEWRKRVRAALGRAAGPKARAAVLPEWTTMAEYVAAIGGVGRPIGPHRHYGVIAVGEIASEGGLSPFDLTADWVTPAAAKLKGPQRRTFKGGITTLNDLVAVRANHPEIAHLLPLELLPQPERAKAPPSPWRRGHRPQAARLWNEFDEFVSAKRGTDDLGRPVPAEKSDFSTRTEETYANALNLATAMLEFGGDLDASMTPGLADICTPEAIARAANLWRTREIDGAVRADGTTRRNMVARLSHIATFHVGLSKKQKKALAKVKKQVRKSSPKSDAMSPPRLAWIKAFAKSPAQQRAVHAMPEKLMAEAKKILVRWDELKRRKRHKERMRALSLGIAAVQSAILFRGSALRATNLRELTHDCEDAQLIYSRETGDVEISIPAVFVKNNVHIEGEFDPDAWPIIEWYLDEIRPLLIRDHPYGCKLVDSDFLFPSSRADQPMEETTFAKHYACGVEAVGLDMTLHQARQVTGYFILSIDPSAMALVAAVLANSIEVAEAHYAWMDGVKAGREARKLLQLARAEARRHRAGTHAALR